MPDPTLRQQFEQMGVAQARALLGEWPQNIRSEALAWLAEQDANAAALVATERKNSDRVSLIAAIAAVIAAVASIATIFIELHKH